jgi:predicted RNA-binding protein with RPS1 domain
MSLKVGAIVSGTIVEVTEEGIVVSLPEGGGGLIPSSASSSIERIKSEFCPGGTVLVSIVSQGEGGWAMLAFAPPREGDGAHVFDQEFHRLNHALTNCSSPQRPVPSDEASVEEQIEEWTGQVKKGLSRLRKHRGRRLNEEFYSAKNG